MMKNWENNGTEETGLVTPTPHLLLTTPRPQQNRPHFGRWHYEMNFLDRNIIHLDKKIHLSVFSSFISYLGMKSWDLHVCDCASTITHVDRVKKSNPSYNKIWLCLNVTIWSSQICLSVIFIHFVTISKYLRKKMHLFTLSSITSHWFSLCLVGSKSMLALLPFKATITPRHLNDKYFHRAGGDLICQFCIHAFHFQCIVGAQQEILCLTVRTTSLIWRVWPRSLRMSVPAW